MSIEEKFERFISNKEKIDKIIFKALPIASLMCLGLAYYIKDKMWRYTLFSYSAGFAAASLYSYYKRFEGEIKNYKKVNFINKKVSGWT